VCAYIIYAFLFVALCHCIMIISYTLLKAMEVGRAIRTGCMLSISTLYSLLAHSGQGVEMGRELSVHVSKLCTLYSCTQVKAMEMGRVLNIWLQLQDAVAGLMDSTLSERASADKQQGIRQVCACMLVGMRVCVCVL
jgi:hypothetical protein